MTLQKAIGEAMAAAMWKKADHNFWRMQHSLFHPLCRRWKIGHRKHPEGRRRPEQAEKEE